MRIHIRWMIRRDMPEVLAIEAASFEFPWMEDDFIRCLRQRNCISMVAEHDDQVVGFTIYELNKSHIHVLNLAVAQACRSHGVGLLLVDELKSKLSVRRRERLEVWVRESNLDAQVFWRAHGFVAVNVIRDAYDNCDEAAYVMRFRVEWQDRVLEGHCK